MRREQTLPDPLIADMKAFLAAVSAGRRISGEDDAGRRAGASRGGLQPLTSAGAADKDARWPTGSVTRHLGPWQPEAYQI